MARDQSSKCRMPNVERPTLNRKSVPLLLVRRLKFDGRCESSPVPCAFCYPLLVHGRFFTFCSTVSLLLCLTMGALWVRSYSGTDVFQRQVLDSTENRIARVWSVRWRLAQTTVGRSVMEIAPAAMRAGWTHERSGYGEDE